MYMIEWLSESLAVREGEATRAILSGLGPVTQYTVTITAVTDSTLCEEQRITYVFSTTQSESGISAITIDQLILVVQKYVTFAFATLLP